MQKRLYWGVILRMMIEGYVIGLLSCLINMKSLDFTEDQDRWTFANSIISVVVLVILTMFPIIAARFLVRNRFQLSKPSMHQRFGEMTHGYNLREI